MPCRQTWMDPRPIRSWRTFALARARRGHGALPGRGGFRGAAPRGSAIVGFSEKRRIGALLRLRLDGYGRTEGTQPAPLGPPRAAPSKSGAAQVMGGLWTHSLAPPPGAFFRRVPGTRLISYDQTPRVHLLDIETGETLRAPASSTSSPPPMDGSSSPQGVATAASSSTWPATWSDWEGRARHGRTGRSTSTATWPISTHRPDPALGAGSHALPCPHQAGSAEWPSVTTT